MVLVVAVTPGPAGGHQGWKRPSSWRRRLTGQSWPVGPLRQQTATCRPSNLQLGLSLTRKTGCGRNLVRPRNKSSSLTKEILSNNSALPAPRGGWVPSRAPEGSGCRRAVMVDTPLHHCVDIGDCVFGVAGGCGYPHFQEGGPGGCSNYRGDQTSVPPREGLLQGAGEESAAAGWNLDSRGVMWFSSWPWNTRTALYSRKGTGGGMRVCPISPHSVHREG